MLAKIQLFTLVATTLFAIPSSSAAGGTLTPKEEIQKDPLTLQEVFDIQQHLYQTRTPKERHLLALRSQELLELREAAVSSRQKVESLEHRLAQITQHNLQLFSSLEVLTNLYESEKVRFQQQTENLKEELHISECLRQYEEELVARLSKEKEEERQKKNKILNQAMADQQIEQIRGNYLQRELKKALAYMPLVKDYVFLEGLLGVYSKQLQNLASKNTTLSLNLATVQETTEHLHKGVSDLVVELHEQKEKCCQYDSELTQANDQIVALNDQVGENLSEKQRLETDVQDLLNELTALRRQVETLQQTEDTSLVQQAELKTISDELSKRNAQLERTLKQQNALILHQQNVLISLIEPEEELKETASQNKHPPLTHEVREGDTLLSLANDYYHSYSRWIDLLEANKELIKNKDLTLDVGKILIIPQP